ncbi:cobalamin B12-binding domain-containing protein [Acinetobacter baumannii]
MKAIVCTIPSDSHSWNLVFMSLFLQDHGYDVVNLGACTPISSILQEIYRNRPDLILVSTVNGHGYIEGVDISKKLKNNNATKNIKLVIGGKVGVSGDENIKHLEVLVNSGFDGVFIENSTSDGLNEFILFLESISKEINVA